MNFFPGSETPFLFTFLQPIQYTRQGAFAPGGEAVYSGPLTGAPTEKKKALPVPGGAKPLGAKSVGLSSQVRWLAGLPETAQKSSSTSAQAGEWSPRAQRYMNPAEAAFAKLRGMF